MTVPNGTEEARFCVTLFIVISSRKPPRCKVQSQVIRRHASCKMPAARRKQGQAEVTASNKGPHAAGSAW
jgi:hypothetical protein